MRGVQFGRPRKQSPENFSEVRLTWEQKKYPPEKQQNSLALRKIRFTLGERKMIGKNVKQKIKM